MRAPKLQYRILDPTGNITALVESPVEPEKQPRIAAEIMALHPEVEQVGFVDFTGEVPALRMAGGEFCGNASLCAGALLLLKRGAEYGVPEILSLRVSGGEEPVELCMTRQSPDRFQGSVCMPPAKEIRRQRLAFGEARGELTLVWMEGISHLIVPPDSAFFPLRQRPEKAEEALRLWCGELGAKGLGLMFLEGEPPCCALTPLVYVPGSDTMFWEHSCASGSSAVGMALAGAEGKDVSLSLRQSGGTLRVESRPQGDTRLYGTVRIQG